LCSISDAYIYLSSVILSVSTPAVEVNQSYREELVYVKGLLAVKLPVYLENSMAGAWYTERSARVDI
jgi:hypothetical protein